MCIQVRGHKERTQSKKEKDKILRDKVNRGCRKTLGGKIWNTGERHKS